jgi:hypothetical protein
VLEPEFGVDPEFELALLELLALAIEQDTEVPPVLLLQVHVVFPLAWVTRLEACPLEHVPWLDPHAGETAAVTAAVVAQL